MADQRFAGSGQRLLAHADALAFHGDKDGQERCFDLVKDFSLAALFELGFKGVPELQRDVGIFDRVVGKIALEYAGVVDAFAFFGVRDRAR